MSNKVNQASAPAVVKSHGLKNLKELSEMSGVSSITLANWYKNRNAAFMLLVKGAAVQKVDNLMAQHGYL